MLDPRQLRAARALADWEQSDLAEAAGVSIATIRKIEQGATGVRPATEARIVAAFEQGGVRLIPDGPDGGVGVRLREGEMQRAYWDLKNRIKAWFIYNHGCKDDDDLDCLINELAFGTTMLAPESLPDLEHNGVKLPVPLVADLVRLEELEAEIMACQDDEIDEAEHEDDLPA